jgi:iron complex transport system substrate-binding protein
MMSQEQKKKWIIGILVVVILAAIAVAGIALSTHNANDDTSNSTQSGKSADTRDLFPDKAYPEYAKGYSVEYHETYKVVHINDAWGRASENTTYLLVQRGEKVPEGYPDARVFYIPVSSVIPLASTQLPYITELNETASIKGMSGTAGIYNPMLQELVRKGRIVEVGSGTQSTTFSLNTEKLIELGPDVVFFTATGNKESDSQTKLQEAGLKTAIDAEWMENDPLARAEWIKYFSLFYNREKTANDVFGRIESNYTAIREKAAGVTRKPTIFSGLDYQGAWYAPGGNSYVTQLFRDAGGNYLLGNNTGRGDYSLSFETVYDQAQNADFWINVGYTDNVNDLLATEPRYAKFEAFTTGRIYHYNGRVNVNGANDYWEGGVVHPDIILADLVKILHPELLPDHELYYYRQIGVNQTGGTV